MEKVRIQDDLYNHVNEEWLEKAIIPDDKPTCGGFADLAKVVEEKMMNEFKVLAKSEEYPNDYLKNAVTLYKKASDYKKRNKAGIKPVLKDLSKIYKLNSVKDLNKHFVEFALSSFPLPVDIGVMEDMKDTRLHCLVIQGPSTILPDSTYYKEPMKAQGDQILAMWKGIAAKVLTYSPLTPEEQELYLENTIKFDAIIASLVKSQEEWSEYTKIYNPMKLSRVNSLLKPLKLKNILSKLYDNLPENIIVADVRFLKGFKELFNEDNFELYKNWAYVNKLIGSTSYLSEELRDLGTSYSRALSGIKVMPTVEKYAYQLAGSYYSEPIGLYYGEKYFGEEAKKDIVEMVHEIIDTYKERIKNNDFLSDATKEKAILKLSTMKVKMGYPDFVDSKYDLLVFDESKSLYEIVSKLKEIKNRYNIDQLYKPVNKNEWVMPGHMVNACYNPTSNDITFPAAILQAPFYSIKQSRSENLGGIGAVIGHEISHAFDNNGAKCDENGNLNNWWTKEDLKNFNNKTKAMIKEFDGIELPWGKVNGKFIVSENIADNGGMACTLNIMSNMKDANYEEYFKNWAKVWCMKAKEEYLKLILSIDVHAPAILRANMQPRNFIEWYKTFDVKKSDKMYLAPNKRVIIW